MAGVLERVAAMPVAATAVAMVMAGVTAMEVCAEMWAATELVVGMTVVGMVEGLAVVVQRAVVAAAISVVAASREAAVKAVVALTVALMEEERAVISVVELMV